MEKLGEDKPQEVAQITSRGCKGLNIGQCFQKPTLPPLRHVFPHSCEHLPTQTIFKCGPWALMVEPSSQVHVRPVGLEEAAEPPRLLARISSLEVNSP